MMMNTRLNIMKVLIILLIAVVDVVAVSAQKRRVEEVKQDMNSLSLSIDNYTNALNKIKPALADAESKDEAETWFKFLYHIGLSDNKISFGWVEEVVP